MPVSGVPWATEVESSPHPGSGECAEDFNNSLTSKETAMKTVISTSKAPAAIGPYSQAIRKGDTLYLSGQIGMVPATGELVSDDVKEQTAQALANMKAILAEAGATPADVTKVTVFIVDMAEFQIVNRCPGPLLRRRRRPAQRRARGNRSHRRPVNVSFPLLHLIGFFPSFP